MNHAVTTPRPGDDLVLPALELNDPRIAQQGTSEGNIWIVSLDAGEVSRDNVICDDIREDIGIRGHIRGKVLDWQRGNG